VSRRLLLPASCIGIQRPKFKRNRGFEGKRPSRRRTREKRCGTGRKVMSGKKKDGRGERGEGKRGEASLENGISY